MNGEERRALIIKALEQSQLAISASKLAKTFSVSRQIIVGDVALIRAAGIQVRATSKGYLLANGEGEAWYLGKVVCQHGPADTRAELALIVSLGGCVLDVAVEHPYYGELTGNLDIRTQDDVDQFVKVVEAGKVRLLSDLTGGIHIHTLECATEEGFKKIKAALKAQGFLYLG